MSDLVFIAFPTEQRAEEVRDKILSMQKEYLIELGDAVIATKDPSGRVGLNQLVNTTAAGACRALCGARCSGSFSQSAARRGGGRGIRRDRRPADRPRHQRQVHEGRGAGARTWHGRPFS